MGRIVLIEADVDQDNLPTKNLLSGITRRSEEGLLPFEQKLFRHNSGKRMTEYKLRLKPTEH